MNIIRVENLTKTFQVNRQTAGWRGILRHLVRPDYEEINAVDSVTFCVPQGQIVGYLGPNGAGKSTTIKMLTGLLVPTSGEVQVHGRVPWQERVEYVRDIGVVFGQRTTLWWDLPVVESLELLQYIYQIPRPRFQQNLRKFSDLLELEPFLNTPVRALSLGQRMRADICAALLHDPALLFLDEPTIGLDVVAKERIRQFVREVNRERGTTIVLTTHDLDDVQRLCERILIIDHGRVLYDGDLDALQTRFGGQRELVVEFVEAYPNPAVADAELIAHSRGQAIYRFERQKISASQLIGRLSAQFRIRDLTVREPDIEETIRRIYEEQLLS
jgi:ABC-2 type transport system ATP-binding protein